MGMISGAGGSGLSDGSSVQSYLTSIEAMIRLDEDHDFIAHYSDPAIDPLARLKPDASNEEAFKVFKKSVKIGYDRTEGLVNMEVIAASPDASVEFYNALIRYAEERVSNITQRLRDDQTKGAIESFEEAQIARNEALDRLVTLQQELAVIDSKNRRGLYTAANYDSGARGRSDGENLSHPSGKCPAERLKGQGFENLHSNQQGSH